MAQCFKKPVFTYNFPVLAFISPFIPLNHRTNSLIDHFRRKKKCIRYKESPEHRDAEPGSDDNLGSCGSPDEAHTPDEDTESLNQSLSSPGCLSGLSSLQSPATSLASPIHLLASPSTPHDVTATMMDINLSVKPKPPPSPDVKMEKEPKIKTEPIEIQPHLNLNLQNFHFQSQAQQLHHQMRHQMLQQRLQPDLMYDKLPVVRNPVGANPRDINNPLSVNQLTKRDYGQTHSQPYFMAEAGGMAFSPPGSAAGGLSLLKQHQIQQMQQMQQQQHHQHLQRSLHSLHSLHANMGMNMSNLTNLSQMAAPLHFQLAAAAHATQQATQQQGKEHHRDEGAISVT